MATQKSDLATHPSLWQRLIAPTESITDPEARRQAQLLAAMLLFLAPFAALGMVYTLLFGTELASAMMQGMGSAVLLGLYFVSRSRRYRLAAWFTIGVLFVAPFGVAIFQGDTGESLTEPFIWSVLPIFLSSIFLSPQSIVVLAAANALGLLVLPLAISYLVFSDVAQPLAFLGGLFGLTWVLNRYRDLVERDRQAQLLESNRELEMVRESLEQRVAERTHDLEQQTIELAAAKDAADLARKEAEVEREKAEALNQLSARLQGQQDLSALAASVIQHLCRYLSAQVGTLFVVEAGVLEPVGSYAAQPERLSKRFKVGEGVIGQAALEKQAISLSDVPEDRVVVASGLGQVIPKQVWVVPFLYQDQVLGVVEIGTLNKLTPAQHEFLTQAMENVAVAFKTAQARTRIDELLIETQQQAEEMQAQEEELRAANEELEAQAESLRASEARLREKQAELQALNAGLQRQSRSS